MKRSMSNRFTRADSASVSSFLAKSFSFDTATALAEVRCHHKQYRLLVAIAASPSITIFSTAAASIARACIFASVSVGLRAGPLAIWLFDPYAAIRIYSDVVSRACSHTLLYWTMVARPLRPADRN